MSGIFFSSSSTKFKSLVAEWRKEKISYKDLVGDKRKFDAHRKIVEKIREYFKKIFRECDVKDLSECIVALKKRSMSILSSNRTKVDSVFQNKDSDLTDFESIVNVTSNRKGKTVLHKLVDRVAEMTDRTPDKEVGEILIKCLFLISAFCGVIKHDIPDVDGETAIKLAAEINHEFEESNDGYSRADGGPGTRDPRAVVYEYIKTLDLCSVNSSGNMQRFKNANKRIALEACTRLDMSKGLRKVARSGTYDDLLHCITDLSKSLCGFNQIINWIIDTVPVNKKDGMTALELVLSRSKSDSEREKIARYLIKHGAHHTCVKNKALREEAKKIRDYFKRQQASEKAALMSTPQKKVTKKTSDSVEVASKSVRNNDELAAEGTATAVESAASESNKSETVDAISKTYLSAENDDPPGLDGASKESSSEKLGAADDDDDSTIAEAVDVPGDVKAPVAPSDLSISASYIAPTPRADGNMYSEEFFGTKGGAPGAKIRGDADDKNIDRQVKKDVPKNEDGVDSVPRSTASSSSLSASASSSATVRSGITSRHEVPKKKSESAPVSPKPEASRPITIHKHNEDDDDDNDDDDDEKYLSTRTAGGRGHGGCCGIGDEDCCIQ